MLRCDPVAQERNPQHFVKRMRAAIKIAMQNFAGSTLFQDAAHLGRPGLPVGDTDQIREVIRATHPLVEREWLLRQVGD
jgi:hypothetical protein